MIWRAQFKLSQYSFKQDLLLLNKYSFHVNGIFSANIYCMEQYNDRFIFIVYIWGSHLLR